MEAGGAAVTQKTWYLVWNFFVGDAWKVRTWKLENGSTEVLVEEMGRRSRVSFGVRSTPEEVEVLFEQAKRWVVWRRRGWGP